MICNVFEVFIFSLISFCVGGIIIGGIVYDKLKGEIKGEEE